MSLFFLPVNFNRKMKKSYLLFTCFFLFCMASHAQQLTVATYNMRYANHDDSINGNGWGQRLPVIASLIQFHDFDIFGTQECKNNQIQDLQHSLPSYTYIGIGRDDGKTEGEYSAIWYKKDKFKLLETHNFWLSTVTDKPNTGWDAALPRICTWGKFQDNKTGFVFYFFNLHMDHIGVVARRESAKLVLQKVKELAGKTATILTGDFNVDQTNESYLLIDNSGLLKDAYQLSPVKLATNGTFNNFDVNSKTDRRIDHIFLSQAFTVQRYGILTDIYWSANDSAAGKSSANAPKELIITPSTPRTPSDHYPVMAVINYSVAGGGKMK